MKKKARPGIRLLVPVILLMLFANGCGKDAAEEVTAQGEAVWQDAAEETGAATEAEGQQERAQVEEIEIDEETREELTTQLLQENELDISILANTRTTRGCTFTLPEDFAEVEDMPGMYVTKRYPIDASTIYYVEMDKDISLQLMTEETFLAMIQNNFEQLYDSGVEINLQSYEKIEIDGYPAFRILCSYTVDEIEITQLEYVVNADKSYVITYSQTHEYDRMEEFEASAATIHLEY